MRILTTVPRSRRALLAAGGAALIGSASIGLLSLGAASAAPEPAAPVPPVSEPVLAVAAPGTLVDVAFDSGPVDVKFLSTDLKQQQDKFVSTLAGKLGVTPDKLQQALKDTQQEVGPVPLLFGAPGGVGAQAFSISISSDVSTAAKVLGISEDQLRQELNGKSLTDVAKAHNVDPQKVASALKAARTSELDQAAQANKIPADIVSRLKANLDRDIEMQMSLVRTGGGMLSGPEMRSVRIIQKDPGQ
jgi:hypothetical protein